MRSNMCQSVHKLTKYRALLEARRRQKWRRYLNAGKCRWQLSNSIRKLREQGSTRNAFYLRRKAQHDAWKEKTIQAMKKLDVIMGAVKYLDESMEGIFAAERELYQNHLD